MYKVKVHNFEGPMDLLLYFIRRDELNIYDIPISKITEEFLSYIKLMKYLDLELAGEFIQMAATLLYIKSQMLLPKTDIDSEQEIEDPRAQLVQKLIEYKQFKDAALSLSQLAENQRYIFYRNLFEQDLELAKKSNGNQFKKASLFDLLNAFQKCLTRLKQDNYVHVVEAENVSIEEKSEQIIQSLKKYKRLSFFDFVQNSSKIHIVVAFLSILNLIKLKQIIIVQNELFDDIYIQEYVETEIMISD